jgi:hypothetical protein
LRPSALRNTPNAGATPANVEHIATLHRIQEPLMNTALFLLSLLIATLGPLLAVGYLKPILLKVLRTLCDAEGGAEFWLRSAYVLAVCGTLLLMLTFGDFRESATVVDTLRRALWLVLASVFVTVGFMARQVWGQIRLILPTKPFNDAASAVSTGERS